jgi:hypothetical protein
VDAWLAHWSVADHGHVVLDEHGNPVRVRLGGALLFRARGRPKGERFGDSVTEWHTLRDRDHNRHAAAAFAGMSAGALQRSARLVVDITPDQIDAAGGHRRVRPGHRRHAQGDVEGAPGGHRAPRRPHAPGDGRRSALAPAGAGTTAGWVRLPHGSTASTDDPALVDQLGGPELSDRERRWAGDRYWRAVWSPRPNEGLTPRLLAYTSAALLAARHPIRR